MGIAADQRALARKKLVFLQHKPRAMRHLRDDLWRWSIGKVKKAAEQRKWGDLPYEVARAPVECRRNRSNTRFHVPRLWDIWSLPLQIYRRGPKANPCTPHTSVHRPNLPVQTSPPSQSPTPITSHNTPPRTAPVTPAKASLTAIP